MSPPWVGRKGLWDSYWLKSTRVPSDALYVPGPRYPGWKKNPWPQHAFGAKHDAPPTRAWSSFGRRAAYYSPSASPLRRCALCCMIRGTRVGASTRQAIRIRTKRPLRHTVSKAEFLPASQGAPARKIGLHPGHIREGTPVHGRTWRFRVLAPRWVTTYETFYPASYSVNIIAIERNLYFLKSSYAELACLSS